MKIKILSAKDYNVKLKCTIHSTGKLGFTETTAERLGFNENSAITFASDEGNGDLYIINLKDMNEDSFKVNKAGTYYNVNTKTLFDNLGFDYINNIISFDMIEIHDKEINEEIYKLIKREKPREQKE